MFRSSEAIDESELRLAEVVRWEFLFVVGSSGQKLMSELLDRSPLQLAVNELVVVLRGSDRRWRMLRIVCEGSQWNDSQCSGRGTHHHKFSKEGKEQEKLEKGRDFQVRLDCQNA